jgi:Asp-tRNA(Asn)/Glu-tRNA(Gln) amidotransferase A subunit family amidase
VHAWQRILCDVEMTMNLAHEYETGRDRLSAGLRTTLERGHATLAHDYARALAGQALVQPPLDALFATYDALITPAAPGVAPRGLETTGNPVFNTIWTFAGTPAITLPLLTGEAGMPLGVQLVGAKGEDARLLRTANWLSRQHLR